MSIKFPRFRGGYFGLLGGGGQCRFYFYGRGDFSEGLKQGGGRGGGVRTEEGGPKFRPPFQGALGLEPMFQGCLTGTNRGPLAAQCEIPAHIAQYLFEIVSQRGVWHPMAFALFPKGIAQVSLRYLPL